MISNRHLILIPCVMMAAVLVVVSLAWNALGPMAKKNGFNRSYRNATLTIVNKMEKKDLIEDVIVMEDKMVIFKTKEPDQLFITSDSLKYGYTSTLPFPNNSWTQPVFSTFINKPNVVLFPNNGQIIMTSRLKSYNTAIKRMPIQVYTRVIPISSDSYVFRAVNPERRAFSFVKYNNSSDSITYDQYTGEEKEVDGVSADGHLLYNESTSSIVYTHFYNNTIQVLDTNLMLKFTMKTIDTISDARQTSKVTNGGFETNTTPTRIINEFSTTAEDKLYVISTLKADNESQTNQRLNNSVDVYDLQKKSYQFSFLLPKHNGQSASSFKIFKDKIVVIYKEDVILYSCQF